MLLLTHNVLLLPLIDGVVCVCVCACVRVRVCVSVRVGLVCAL